MPKNLYVADPQDGCAWVTGASSGIGRALALGLALSGWRVAVTARSATALQELAQEARDLPGSIHSFPGDVTDTGLMDAHCRAIRKELGG